MTSQSRPFAPAKTPPGVIAKINAEIARIVKQPDTIKRFLNAGLTAESNDPAAFSAFIKREIDKWTKVVKAAGIRAD